MAELFSEQIDHVQNIEKIFSRYKYALDLSNLGTGKTYTGCYLALKSKCKNILVISPKCVEEKWKEVAKLFNLNIEVITYNSFRSITNCQPKHGYLTREDTTVEVKSRYGYSNEQKKTDFSATDKLSKKVKEGMFVIVDEFQNVKNMSDQTKACMEVVNTILHFKKSSSRILLISGSPFDKKEQIVSFYRLIKVMKFNQVIMHNPRTLIIEWKGMAEIFSFCKEIDSKLSERLMPNTLMSIGVCHDAIYKSFQEIVKPVISSCMIGKINDYSVNVEEAHYHMVEQNRIKPLRNAIVDLRAITQVDPTTGKMAPDAWSAIGGYLRKIELIKIVIFIRIIKQELMFSNKKIVVCFNFTDSIFEVANYFSQYKPLILNGSVNSKKRHDIINKFSQNNDDYRLLIGNLQVCSTGIDLDDKFGSRKRFALVSPTYNSQNIYQFGHRFDRTNTKSQADVHLIFCKEASEIKILNALSKKGTIMKETTPDHSKNGTKFPGEYPQYIEPEDYNKKFREKQIAFTFWFCKQDNIGLSEVSALLSKYIVNQTISQPGIL